jgi:hypothetical protein
MRKFFQILNPPRGGNKPKPPAKKIFRVGQPMSNPPVIIQEQIMKTSRPQSKSKLKIRAQQRLTFAAD